MHYYILLNFALCINRSDQLFYTHTVTNDDRITGTRFAANRKSSCGIGLEFSLLTARFP